VYGYDVYGVFGDGGFDGGWVEVEVVGGDVCEYWGGVGEGY